MNRNRVVRLLTLFLIAGLLAAGTGPARGQDDMETFKKPAWRLTLQYPPGWEVTEESGAVSIVFEGDGKDVALFAVAQDPEYADTETSMEDLFWRFLDKVEGQAENVAVEEAEPRQIASVEARSGYLTATEGSTGLELDGSIYQLVSGGKGYLVLALATRDYLEAHQPEFYDMLDSLRLGAAAAPTRTPRPRRTARPSGTPTEEAVETPEAEPTEETVETPEAEATEEANETPEAEATEEAVETPEAKPTEEAIEKREAEPTEEDVETLEAEPTRATAVTATPVVTTTRIARSTLAASRPGYLTAREAYDLALPQASIWEDSPSLAFARCPVMELSGPDAGRCASWKFHFAKLKGEDFQGFEVIVTDGAVASYQELGRATYDREIISNWGDSPEILDLVQKQMGASFDLHKLYGHPAIDAELRGSFSSPEESYWTFSIRGLSAPPNSANQRELLTLTALATSGNLFEIEPSSDAHTGKPVTAREALPVAEKKAREWNKDARLVAAGGTARAGEPGQQEGKARLWRFHFGSEWAEQTRSFHVQDGQVVLEENAFAYSKDPVIAGEWPDSPAALDGFVEKYPSYAAFVHEFPEHDWMMSLNQVGDITRWWINATVPGIELFVNPAAE